MVDGPEQVRSPCLKLKMQAAREMRSIQKTSPQNEKTVVLRTAGRTKGEKIVTKIILVRHCEAQGNTLGLLQGRTDCDVSGNSGAQLELVSLRLRNTPISAIYSSPLKRAYKTAQAINRYHELPIRTDPRLIEIDIGAWEGRSWASIEAEDSELFRLWEKNPGKFAAKGGESMRQVGERMWDAVTDIVRKNPGGTVCVTSHGCAIRCFLCLALGKPIEELGDVDWCDNTAISEIDFDREGRSRVVRMNDASHIAPELSVYRRGGEENWSPESSFAVPARSEET